MCGLVVGVNLQRCCGSIRWRASRLGGPKPSISLPVAALGGPKPSVSLPVAALGGPKPSVSLPVAAVRTCPASPTCLSLVEGHSTQP
jgi:hypothetical protein